MWVSSRLLDAPEDDPAGWYPYGDNQAGLGWDRPAATAKTFMLYGLSSDFTPSHFDTNVVEAYEQIVTWGDLVADDAVDDAILFALDLAVARYSSNGSTDLYLANIHDAAGAVVASGTATQMLLVQGASGDTRDVLLYTPFDDPNLGGTMTPVAVTPGDTLGVTWGEQIEDAEIPDGGTLFQIFDYRNGIFPFAIEATPATPATMTFGLPLGAAA